MDRSEQAEGGRQAVDEISLLSISMSFYGSRPTRNIGPRGLYRGMKTFYEMLQILERRRTWQNVVNSGPSHWDDPGAEYVDPTFHVDLMGLENHPPVPFFASIFVHEGYWECELTSSTPFFAHGYRLDGSENPASRPVQENDGVKFQNPGKRLELLPDSIRDRAIKWVDDEIKWQIKNYSERERD